MTKQIKHLKGVAGMKRRILLNNNLIMEEENGIRKKKIEHQIKVVEDGERIILIL